MRDALPLTTLLATSACYRDSFKFTLLSSGHTYGSITDTVNIIKTEKKVKHTSIKSIKTDYT
jgi:hypothetical protein